MGSPKDPPFGGVVPPSFKTKDKRQKTKVKRQKFETKNHAQHGGCFLFAGMELRDHRRSIATEVPPL